MLNNPQFTNNYKMIEYIDNKINLLECCLKTTTNVYQKIYIHMNYPIWGFYGRGLTGKYIRMKCFCCEDLARQQKNLKILLLLGSK